MSDLLMAREFPLAAADSAAALIVLEDGRYLMQARDVKPAIFYPGHWGLFGGAIELGEPPDVALRRELQEELELDVETVRQFTSFSFDFRRYGRIWRHFYEVRISASVLGSLVLREGRAMQAFSAEIVVGSLKVAPYDSFAIFLHATEH